MYTEIPPYWGKQGSHTFPKLGFNHFLSIVQVHFRAFPAPYRFGKFATHIAAAPLFTLCLKGPTAALLQAAQEEKLVRERLT